MTARPARMPPRPATTVSNTGNPANVVHFTCHRGVVKSSGGPSTKISEQPLGTVVASASQIPTRTHHGRARDPDDDILTPS